MQEFSGYTNSFAGFVDYSLCYPVPSPLWIALGTAITLGCMVSVLPQIVVLVRRRTSYGLNPLYVFVTSFGQFMLVMNVVSLHTADFIGILQIPLATVLPRLLTFGITFTMWFFYMPVPFLNAIFFDNNQRIGRNEEVVAAERFWNTVLTGLMPFLGLGMVFVYTVQMLIWGVSSSTVMVTGRVYGTFAAVLVIAQYLPQMITTCKLKDNGSLSMALMLMQAPGGLANVLFMAIGQGDDWTTWISLLAGSIQMFILLGICTFFKLRRRRKVPIEDQSFVSIEEGTAASNANEYTTPASVF